MSTHLPGFQSFFRYFASFGIDKMSYQQHKVKTSNAYSGQKQQDSLGEIFQRNI